MREFVLSDFDDVHRLDSDARVMKYITGKPATREETQATICLLYTSPSPRDS